MSATSTATGAGADLVVVTETGEGGYQVEVRVGAHSFLADEPQAVGGLGTGPNPFDLLRAALGACTVITTRLYANRKGWPVTRISASVTHHPASGDQRDRFDRTVTLEGDLDEVQRARLIDIASRCPVSQTLSRGSDVGISLAS